jgi:hypothetical protein
MRDEAGVVAERNARRRLYLFSSNMQPLYSQHALDILSMPSGGRTTLRYDKKWVNSKAQALWGDDLVGVPVLMHFSLQQGAQYVEPAFFPIRAGRVTSATKEGPYHFVEVDVNDYVSLKAPPSDEDRDWTNEELADNVRSYQRFLKNHNIDRPYPSSAALAQDILTDACKEVLDTAGVGDPHQLDIELFRRNAVYLQRTESFQHARFLRFLRLTARGDSTLTQDRLTGDTPHLNLLRGRTYDIELFSYQPRGVTSPEAFEVSTDDSFVQVIGQGRFEVASRYDRISVALRAQIPRNASPVQTLVLIEPGPLVHGPTIELPIEIRERTGARMASTGAAVLSLGLLVAASIVSTGWVKPILLIAGLLLAFALQWHERPIASLVGPAASGVPAQPHAAAPVVGATSPRHHG